MPASPGGTPGAGQGPPWCAGGPACSACVAATMPQVRKGCPSERGKTSHSRSGSANHQTSSMPLEALTPTLLQASGKLVCDEDERSTQVDTRTDAR
eukprot:6124649-Pleurochrysis_carterae.AAC.2